MFRHSRCLIIWEVLL